MDLVTDFPALNSVNNAANPNSRNPSLRRDAGSSAEIGTSTPAATEVEQGTWSTIVSQGSGDSRMKMSYFPSVVTEDKTVVYLPPSVEAKGCEQWADCVVGHFLEKKVPYLQVRNIVKQIWKKFGIYEVLSNDNGFYFFKFSQENAMRKVIEAGPWLIAGQSSGTTQLGEKGTMPVPSQVDPSPVVPRSGDKVTSPDKKSGSPRRHAPALAPLKICDGAAIDLLVKQYGGVQTVKPSLEERPLPAGEDLGDIGFLPSPAPVATGLLMNQFSPLAIAEGDPVKDPDPTSNGCLRDIPPPLLVHELEMEHFGDLEEQVSISIDQNEIPVLDSEDDSFSSSVFDEFGIFKRNGLTRIHEGSKCYHIITGCIAKDMINDTNVAAVHKIPWSGSNGRLEAFRISSAEMVKKCGGNGNAKHAWYGGSRDEICQIITHGFKRCRQSDNGEDGFGVHLYPLELVMDGLLTSTEDDYGLRHLLMCNVILGKTEVVRLGSKQFKPSSDEFDSGVDDLLEPNRIVIWEAYMNSRIFPSSVVSFRAFNVRGFGRDRTPVYKPTTQCVEFSVLIPKLANVLPSSKMAVLHKYQSEFRRNKISRAQLIYRLRQLAGDELLSDVIKTRESDGTGAA
ncbi:hypothetical protein RHMOL_Rhmol04G0117600 [Rhododendron molle]|uniref:Uncharacterized protein n=1 Tax=Rhododendron molle TaxID=49168 RepID=A0ACC0P0G4_RHOML|nr:hypothetical protein RHMOL_Rhmol04G0117600 [Rhododendron molle]